MDYYTVTEYAQKTGKDPGNIRRMLIKGKIKGKKMGSQWIILKGTEYPEDGRIKSGAYRSWRKKGKINRSMPGLLDSLGRMASRIGCIYGDQIESILLYGSYARGEQTEDSDVDIAIIIKPGATEEMHDEMIDVVVEYELDLARTLSVVPIEYENYVQWNMTLPFYKNIKKEGIVLWKAV